MGVDLNAIAPGAMATDNTVALRNHPVRSRQTLERIPAGHWGEPTDLACSPRGITSTSTATSWPYTAAAEVRCSEDGASDDE
jgi:2-deoxy-D-gluconate 3-dehydrogenase